MKLWENGDFDELISEGKAIQQRLPPHKNSPGSNEHLARTFSNLMFEGKTKAALCLLSEHGSGGVLHFNNTISTSDGKSQSVLQTLKEKHPIGAPANKDALLTMDEEPPDVHPIVFDCIDAPMIKSAALRTSGSAGPSGIDAKGWRRLCTSFKKASSDLCRSLAKLAKRLCTSYVDPAGLSPLLACRLIALDKNPGVRPIGICETARRIVAKAILFVT